MFVVPFELQNAICNWKRIARFCVLLLFVSSIQACSSEQTAKPRPRQYPYISLPNGSTVQTTLADCPFELPLPDYYEIVPQSNTNKEVGASCWFDIKLRQIGATVHCSYYAIGPNNELQKLKEDAYVMASKHNVKATYREEIPVENVFGATGIIFDIQGPVASPYQFYLTDEQSHFIRGSLYFNSAIEQDSMGPMLEFVRADLSTILGGLKWK